jgi:tetratricopeptide (TPR) repeat protein
MSNGDPLHDYLKLSNDLFQGRYSETDLPSVVILKLPPLDRLLLDRIADHAESLAFVEPHLGWALTRIAQEASSAQNCDLLLRSLAAWYLARAGNHWAQPARVQEAVQLARQGFRELNDPGWLAACDWQANALPWAQPDFAESARRLHAALPHLKAEFAPHCRLALAFAQILTGDHSTALENAMLSETAYEAKGDILNQARCWLTQASALRRQDRFEEAFQKLDQARRVFEEMNARTEQARAHFQIALGCLLQTDQLPAAVDHFNKAIALFEETDLDLWRGMCLSNLGAVYLFRGELTPADRHYRQAGEIFERHGISGLLADNLNDQGEVNILRGMPQAGIEQLSRSAALNEQLGSQLSAAVSLTNLGKAYGQNGRYQDALYYLEQAAARLSALDSHLRLGTCQKYAALIWVQLGQPELAHAYLDQASQSYELAGQEVMLSEIHNIRAAAYFQQERVKEAIDCLGQALEVSLRHSIKPQAVLARRLLGEALTRVGRFEEALGHLDQAQAEASEAGLQMELAASLAAIATRHAACSRPAEAQSAFENALLLSEGIL